MLIRIRPNVKIKRIPFNIIRRNLDFNHSLLNRIPNNRGSFLKNYENPEISSNSNFLSDFLDIVDEGQIKLKKYIQAQPQFFNSLDYCQLETLTNVPEIAKPHHKPKSSYPAAFQEIPIKEPISSFEDILHLNESSSPTIGSFIEFIDPSTNVTSFGIVIRDSQSKFNENYNKLIVLNVSNELSHVAIPNIRLHFNNVIDKDYITGLGILENRFNDKYQNRLFLVQVLKFFIDQSFETSEVLSRQFDTIYAQKSRQFTVTGISVVEIIELLVFPEIVLNGLNESYWNQCSILLSIHLNLLNSTNFIVHSTDFINGTNTITQNCSNELVKNCTYMINSKTNAQAIKKLISDLDNDEIFTRTNQFMNQLYLQQTSMDLKSFDDLNHYFNIWEGRQYKHIIDGIKFAIIYPHTKLMKQLRKLDVFKQFTRLTCEELLFVLENLKIYNNKNCPATDIYLSSNIVGKPSLSKLAVSSHRELTSNIDSEFLHSGKLDDKFPHLRNSKRYYTDHVIYGIPYAKSKNDPDGSDSYLAISLEKINARRYIINVHIPDVMTKLPPNSELFNAIITRNFKAITKLTDFSSINNFFDPKFLKRISFSNQDAISKNEWIQVGDMSLDYPLRQYYSKTTCLTLSLTYDSYESNPFGKLSEKVKFSFDSLSSVRIKNLSWKNLDDCLEGKFESSPFRLFKRNPERIDEAPVLSDQDCHYIRFIYSVMKSHFKIRNANGASIVEDDIDCTNSSDIEKEVSYVDKNGKRENVITNVKRNNYDDKFKKAKFLVNELNKFVGNCTSLYCIENDIPIFRHSQKLLPSVYSEEVAITHNNILLPRYHASEYSQTLFSRDAQGYVSLPASIIGKNFLGCPYVGVYGDVNIVEGMEHGYIKMIDVVNDCESLLNQLQILNHIQLLSFNEYCLQCDNHLDVIQKFSYLKSHGYNLNGPFDAQTLTNQISNIINADNVNHYLGARIKRYWTLKMIEQRLLVDKFTSVQEATTNYECIITFVGPKLEKLNIQLCSAYCQVLQLEIQVAVNIDDNFTIGTKISCDKVIYLNPVSGHCILRQAYTL